MKRKILFLSGDDFKEKSIQVIRKTPEAYLKAGWDVHYIVGRDTSLNGDYFYEPVINPPGIHVYRFLVPFAKLHGMINNGAWKAVWFRVRRFSLAVALMVRAQKLMRIHKFDVVYGYEIPGVLALRLLRLRGLLTQVKTITRFQGVLFVKEWIVQKQRFRFLSNPDAILAVRTKADLCIMTNDGSRGTSVLRKLRSPVKRVVFFPNGVDPLILDPDTNRKINEEFYSEPGLVHFLSVSRLDHHKRIDRGLRLMHSLVNDHGLSNLRYTIVGGGAEMNSLQDLALRLGLSMHVRFLGPIRHDLVKYHFVNADVFVSMYTSTNVGNPLLEAIRANKLILTLNNGDTGQWIQHKRNGLIYPIDDVKDLSEDTYRLMARDVVNLLNDDQELDRIKSTLKQTEQERLWTWGQRFDAEIQAVDSLFQKN